VHARFVFSTGFDCMVEILIAKHAVLICLVFLQVFIAPLKLLQARAKACAR
jgi:hypothetical protein